MEDAGFDATAEELRQLREANVIAAQFFRRELLLATDGWPVRSLKDVGLEHVLSADSAWQIGYAPDTRTSLVDHLAGENFTYTTMDRAGLVVRTGEADVVDRFRDQLVLVTRDAQLRPAGFIGIQPDGTTQPISPATVIHQPSNVLAGIDEQLDLLRDGATPVIVDHPFDAIAVSNASRQLGGQWAGIPVCADGLSTAQVRMLRKFSRGDTAIVVASGDEHRRKLTSAYLFDLARSYPQVMTVAMSHSLSLVAAQAEGPELLKEVLSTSSPSMTYRLGNSAKPDLLHDPEPPDHGPDL